MCWAFVKADRFGCAKRLQVKRLAALAAVCGERSYCARAAILSASSCLLDEKGGVWSDWWTIPSA